MLRNLLSFIFICVFIVGCGNFQRSKPRAQIPQVANAGNSPQAAPIDEGGEGDSSSSQGSDFQEGPVSVNQQQVPRVGLILGPWNGEEPCSRGCPFLS